MILYFEYRGSRRAKDNPAFPLFDRQYPFGFMVPEDDFLFQAGGDQSVSLFIPGNAP